MRMRMRMGVRVRVRVTMRLRSRRIAIDVPQVRRRLRYLLWGWQLIDRRQLKGTGGVRSITGPSVAAPTVSKG